MKKQEKGGRAIRHFVSAVPSITSVRFSHLPNLVVNVLRKLQYRPTESLRQKVIIILEIVTSTNN